MTRYSREIYEYIMRPMVARGEVEIWHHQHLHRVDYSVRCPMQGVRP